jgi:hypothetical protein
MISQQFLEMRARFPATELALHRGKWVAFSRDCRIVASAPTPEDLDEQLAALGLCGQDVVLEWVPGPDEDCKLGASEWQ